MFSDLQDLFDSDVDYTVHPMKLPEDINQEERRTKTCCEHLCPQFIARLFAGRRVNQRVGVTADKRGSS